MRSSLQLPSSPTNITLQKRKHHGVRIRVFGVPYLPPPGVHVPSAAPAPLDLDDQQQQQSEQDTLSEIVRTRSFSRTGLHHPLAPSSPPVLSVSTISLDELLQHDYLTAQTAHDTSFLRGANGQTQSSQSQQPTTPGGSNGSSFHQQHRRAASFSVANDSSSGKSLFNPQQQQQQFILSPRLGPLLSVPQGSPLSLTPPHNTGASISAPSSASSFSLPPSNSSGSLNSLTSAPSRLWIQVSNLLPTTESNEVLRTIAAHFRLHPVTIGDLQSDETTREKLEVFSSYLFMVSHVALHPTPTIFDIVQQEAEEVERRRVEEERRMKGLASTTTTEDSGVRKRKSSMRAPSAQYRQPSLVYNDDENPFDGAVPKSVQTEPTTTAAAAASTRSRQFYRLPTRSRGSGGGSSNGIFRSAGLQTAPIQLIIFPNLVLSFHHGDSSSEINSICRKLDLVDETRMDTGQTIIHAMLDVVSSSLRPIVDEVEYEVNLLEELIYSLDGEQYANLLKRMGLTRRRLVILKQALKSKMGIVNSLIGRGSTAPGASSSDPSSSATLFPSTSLVNNVQTPYLRDVQDLLDIMLVKIECSSEVLEALQDSYLANVQLRSEMMSRNVNLLMKRFSAVATILLPLSLISSIMGMNVFVPNNLGYGSQGESQIPFWTIIFVMVVSAGLGLLVFKRKGFI